MDRSDEWMDGWMKTHIGVLDKGHNTTGLWRRAEGIFTSHRAKSLATHAHTQTGSPERPEATYNLTVPCPGFPDGRCFPARTGDWNLWYNRSASLQMESRLSIWEIHTRKPTWFGLKRLKSSPVIISCQPDQRSPRVRRVLNVSGGDDPIHCHVLHRLVMMTCYTDWSGLLHVALSWSNVTQTCNMLQIGRMLNWLVATCGDM